MGRVVNAQTGDPLYMATVKVLNSRRGTYTTKQGTFVLTLRNDRDTIMVSHLGYLNHFLIPNGRDTVVEIKMQDKPLKSREVVVIAENPAERIMRKVLSRKARQSEILDSYAYTLYSKFVAITDTLTAARSAGIGDSTVFAILESYSHGYFEKPDKYFNEIIQRRQSANIPPQANFVSFGTNLNAYDDIVEVIGEKIVTPFHPNALDWFDFTLESDEADTIVQISFEVRRARKAFRGSVFVNTVEHIPVEVRVQPTESVSLPFDASLNYRQTFTTVQDMVLPEALAITSSMEANILFLFAPRLDISIETFCYDYDVTTPLQPGIFDRRRVEVSDAAYRFDTLFWYDNQKVPLRPEEEQAYEDIRIALENPDSLLTTTFLDQYIGPVTRSIARFNRHPFTGFEDVFRYNRVHGLYLGMGLRNRPDTSLLVSGRMGYAFGNQQLMGRGQVSWWFDPAQRWSVDFTAASEVVRRDDISGIVSGVISTASLFLRRDYGDYYKSSGIEAGMSYGWGQLKFIRHERWARPSEIRMYYRDEQHESTPALNVYSVFRDNTPWRGNPLAVPGRLRSVGAQFRYAWHPERIISRSGLHVSMEYANREILKSDFSFRRLEIDAMFRFTSLPLWTTDIVVGCGYQDGLPPIQKLFSPESQLSGIAGTRAMRGMEIKEYYGQSFVSAIVTHNFGEVIPGLLRIPGVAVLGVEILASAGVSYTRIGQEVREAYSVQLPDTHSTRESMYYEVGIGFNRLLLLFRIDVSARLSQTDSPRMFITIGPALF